LREPPTRQQVGMDEGRKTVFYEINMKEPRKVTFYLPEDITLTIPVYMVSFESAGYESQKTSDPTGIDARTSSMPLEETIELYRSTLKQLGLDTSKADMFEEQAEEAQERKDEAGPTDRTTSPSSARTYDYLKLSVVAVYQPDVDTGLVKLIGVWGDGIPKSRR